MVVLSEQEQLHQDLHQQQEIKNMKKTMYKISSAIILSTSFLSVIPSTVSAQTVESNNMVIKGIVADLKTTLPLKDVYIKQQNTLNTVLTDENGNFSITLEKGASRTLTVTKEGYDTQQLVITGNQDTFRISLAPIVKYNNQNLPAPHSDAADIFNYSTRPISSNFSAMYQIKYQASKIPTLPGTGSITSSGWSINEIAAQGQIRFTDWLGSVKVFRGRYPINVENFQFNPAYYLDTTQFQLGGGKVFKVSDKIDFYAGLSYLLHFTTPDNRGGSDNKPIPYTNSHQDFPSTRQGPGITGILGYLLRDNVILNANATLYPVVFTTFDSLAQSNMGYHGMFEIGGNVKVETLPGVYVTGSYTNQFFFGFSNFMEDANIFNIGVSLDPFKMANIAQNTSTSSGNGTITGK